MCAAGDWLLATGGNHYVQRLPAIQEFLTLNLLRNRILIFKLSFFTND
jgi:hypothetical protein